LDEIQTIVLRAFLLVIHSHPYSFAMRFQFLAVSVKEKVEKPDRKPYPLPYMV
jgi:hypothetical protein